MLQAFSFSKKHFLSLFHEIYYKPYDKLAPGIGPRMLQKYSNPDCKYHKPTY